MALPCAVIVGRPNVGKSTLFNRLVGRRVAIVEPSRGVTRDRVAASAEHEGVAFELVDTGGMGVTDAEGLSEHIERQIRIGLEEADVVVFVVDVRDGVLPHDQEIADRLRGIGKPVVLVATKVESPTDEASVGELFRLGLGEPLPVSAVQGRGCGDLLDAVVASFPPGLAQEPEPVAMRLAIVGRRNVGKSTFVNAIAGSERVIVSDVPGTTRDAVDVRFVKDGRTFVIIDTAGARKRGKIRSSIDFYAFTRAQKSIARADVTLLMLDAVADLVELDKRLAGEIGEQAKPCVITVNKWDLARGRMTTADYTNYLERCLPVLDYAPISFVSAKAGRRVIPTIELAQQLLKQARLRAPTAAVNEALHDAVQRRSPPPRRGRVAKLYYATQVDVEPPTIVVFANDPELVAPGYRRYLAAAFRERLPFPEVPVRLHVRPRRRGDGG
ncbi:MAG: ribosome biogenesis GTPase Der [bacterium]